MQVGLGMCCAAVLGQVEVLGESVQLCIAHADQLEAGQYSSVVFALCIQ